MKVQTLQAEGLDIQVTRSATGLLVVDIDTGDLADSDTHTKTGVPNIRIQLNEAPIRFEEDGSIIEEYEDSEPRPRDRRKSPR